MSSSLPPGTELVKKSNKNLIVGMIIGFIFCLILTIWAVNNPMSELIGLSSFLLAVVVVLLVVDNIVN